MTTFVIWLIAFFVRKYIIAALGCILVIRSIWKVFR